MPHQSKKETGRNDNGRRLKHRFDGYAAEQRRVINDPTGPYKDRSDLRQVAETRIAARLLRDGATPKVETPQTVAQRQHDAAFSFCGRPTNTVEIINQRTAEIATPGDAEIDRIAAELRAEIGRWERFGRRTIAAQGRSFHRFAA